jgi:quinol monooxygenase YgiN
LYELWFGRAGRVCFHSARRNIRIFEVYADADAYNAHLESPHFKKYKTSTQKMVKSLKLVESNPILLGANAK